MTTEKRMIELSKLNLCLMCKYDKVLDFSISLNERNPSFSRGVIYNESLLPNLIKMGKSLKSWFLWRSFPLNTFRNIRFAQFASISSNRTKYDAFFLSLANNSVNLSDKYWVNIDCDTAFKYQNTNYYIPHNDYNNINPFTNVHLNDIDKHALNDTFVYHNKEHSYESFVWSTNGEAKKSFLIRDNKYHILKRATSDLLIEELTTFDFFKRHGFVTPDWLVFHCDIGEPGLCFDIDSSNYGVSFIQKKCLTDNDSILVPLSDFINSDYDLSKPATQLCQTYNIAPQMFIDAVSQFMAENNISNCELDTTNIGLLVHENKPAQFAVWSRLGQCLDIYK